VDGSGYGSYTLVVTDPETPRAQTPSQTNTPGISPTASPSGTVLTFASVSAGGNHTYGVITSGAAYCWGWDFYSQLGNGPVDDDQLNPVPVSGGLSFASVSAGSEHTCGVTTTGAAYCWGVGSGGQLGNGSTGDEKVPVAVSGGLVFKSVSAGITHSCGVITTGAAYCWGKGFSGQPGNSSYDDSSTPAAVSGGLTFASVSAGNGHACGITTSGAVHCWGEFHIPLSTSPTPVSAGIALASIDEYYNHTCGVETSGAAYC
jgi:alpha-tubulin suppressor-like RCC1 family protein